MTDLPKQSTTNPPVGGQPTTTPVSPGGSKEIGGAIGASFSEFLKPVETGHDVSLPKEVISVGVKPTPTVVQIPPKLQKHGLVPVGQNVPPTQGKAVTLPLTDQQIAEGLTKNINDSLRWLAEWCRRKLLQYVKRTR